MSKIKYHFFGKECLVDRGLEDLSDLNKNLQNIGFNSRQQPVFVSQIHSNDVVTITDEKQVAGFNPRPKADGIVTNLKNVIICLITADCLPILLFDDENSVIALVHCGWRGARGDIITNATEKMLAIGAKIENINAIIGPCIRQESYEISEPFYQDFISENIANKSFFIPSTKPEHYMFDLPAYSENKLRRQKITKIIDTKIDTYSNPEKLFSYRRSCHLQEKDCGRNVSVIML